MNIIIFLQISTSVEFTGTCLLFIYLFNICQVSDLIICRHFYVFDINVDCYFYLEFLL